MVDFDQLTKDLKQGANKRQQITATLAGKERELTIRPLQGPESDDVTPIVSEQMGQSSLSEEQLQTLKELQEKEDDEDEELDEQEEQTLKALRAEAEDSDNDVVELWKAMRRAGIRGLTLSEEEVQERYREEPQLYRGLDIDEARKAMEEDLQNEVRKGFENGAVKGQELFVIGKKVLELNEHSKGK